MCFFSDTVVNIISALSSAKQLNLNAKNAQKMKKFLLNEKL